MENYSKGRSTEQPSVCPFSLVPDTPEVRVKDGSKIRNLLRYALSRIEAKSQVDKHDGGGDGEVNEDPPSRPLCRQLVFTASGKGVSKAITCAEVVKRRVRGLHQLTSLASSTLTDVWDPLEPAVGLDSITVSRKLPVIWILLSKDPLDHSLPGYQAPGRCDNLWTRDNKEEVGAYKRKRGGGGGRGRGGGRNTGRSRDLKASI
ncbi:ribonuclease P protein subunit p25-like protein [Hippocampus comes]|uniref:ribonuclease P protein subunit p25-like protein n=1 Tax=Hippocampus comes TaxID=109280 RepID=UPI00094F0FC0|nr:PREDICTED: ribonuclease P protein subunit p25-like protein [Hippocampus comes]